MVKHQNIVVFDFETTGLYPDRHEILELAAIRYEKVDGKFIEVNRVSSLLKVDLPLDSKIIEITNITDQMIEDDGEDIQLILNQFLDLIDPSSLLVGYNVGFDLGFLLETIKRSGFDYEITNDILDVMAVYKDHYSFPHRLESVVSQFNILHPNTHRATDDVIATMMGLESLSNVVDDINKYINIIGFNPKYPPKRKVLPYLSYIAQAGGRKEIEKL